MSYPYITCSNLNTFCVFLTHFVLNHVSHTHKSLIDTFMHFRKNPFIKCSNYYIIFSKPCHPCHIVQTTIESNPWKKHKPNVETHILRHPEWHFMIKQTLKQQKLQNNTRKIHSFTKGSHVLLIEWLWENKFWHLKFEEIKYISC